MEHRRQRRGKASTAEPRPRTVFARRSRSVEPRPSTVFAGGGERKARSLSLKTHTAAGEEARSKNAIKKAKKEAEAQQ